MVHPDPEIRAQYERDQETMRRQGDDSVRALRKKLEMGDTDGMVKRVQAWHLLMVVVAFMASGVGIIWGSGYRAHAVVEDFQDLPARITAVESRADALELRANISQRTTMAALDSIREGVKWNTCVQWRTLWGDTRDAVMRRCGLPPEERIR